MKNIEMLKTKSQESITHLVDLGKQQPAQLQTWGITAATAVVGGIALAAAAKGLLAIVGALAAPPISLTVGALGGGAVGWNFMQRRSQSATTDQPAASTPADADVITAFANAPAAAPTVPMPTATDLPVAERAPTEQTAPSIGIIQTDETAPLEAAPPEATRLEVALPEITRPEAAPEVMAPLYQTVETTAPVELPPAEAPGHLEAINGIGAGYARRLHEAGIHTFADLAQQTPEQLRALISIDRRVTDEQLLSWIEQAQALAV